ncbi:MAG: ATP-binding protein, partial [Psychrobacter sp.]|nr:ATP-binding protein [Psychrobacter sp.]
VNPYQKSDDNRQVDIDTILSALSTLDDRIGKTLNVDGDDNVYLTIEGQETELNELSSGFISVVKIIQAIVSAYSAFTNTQDLLGVKGVVLIDEIESHLHVEWQTRIIPTLKELFPNTTFYIATHSPLVLSQLDEGEAYLLKREEDGVVRSHVIDSPNKRILANVLRDTFDIDLNALKRESMQDSDQDLAKTRLLKLLRETGGDNDE